MTFRPALLALPLLLLAACGQGEKTPAAHDASPSEAAPKGPVRVAVAPGVAGRRAPHGDGHT